MKSSLTEPASGVILHSGYAATMGATAYVWGWPLVNMLNRSTTITKAPQPALLNGVLPAAPRGQLAMLHDYIEPSETFVACPNQDVVYGLGFFSLDEEPVVVQVPDFGERFWVYAAYDARTNQFGELGKQYGTQRGHYLLVGPNWKGEPPSGVRSVIRSPTAPANVIPRVFMEDTPDDRRAIQPVINQIVAYPLKEFDETWKTIEWNKAPTIQGGGSHSGETRWVVPEEFFERLGTALATVPPLPGEEALYGQFRVLLEARSKDPEIAKTLQATALSTERDVIHPFFEWKHNGRPAGNGWNRSTNNAQTGLDYFNRTGTAKSNMFDNRPTETQYYYTDFDAAGQSLTGRKDYEVTFPPGQEPPVNGFWSLTLYNELHLFHPNSLGRYSLGTKNKNLVRNEDGSLTFYVSSGAPGKARLPNWLPAPKGPFSLYLRAYWGKQAILDGSWQPPFVRATGAPR